MAKAKTSAPRSLTTETELTFLWNVTMEWWRISAKNADAAVTDAISNLSARGLIEVHLVALVKMGDEKMKCRYIGGGAWWTLLQKELDRLVPQRWIGADGKPKKDLLKGATVVAVRLTPNGADFKRAVKADAIKEWGRRQPKTIKPYLRCDGIDARSAVPLLDLSAGPDKAVIRLGTKCITLTPNEELTMTALVNGRAMNLSDLRRVSDDSHADRTLKRLVKKNPSLEPFITIPGGNNRGGYSTRILLA